jgi:uncharacterized protein
MVTASNISTTMTRPRIFLTTEWRHIAMVNFEVDPALLAKYVPPGTELDCWNGKTFLTLVGLRFSKTKVLGIPFPFHRSFDEVNLRFYVRRIEAGELRRGVVFIKEIVPRWAVAVVARGVYNENYVAMPMRYLNEYRGRAGLYVKYTWRAGRRLWNNLSVNCPEEPALPQPGSEEEFIVEHNWGYTAHPNGRTTEYRLEHRRWNVWRGTEAEVEGDTSDHFGKEFARAILRTPSSSFIADGSDDVTIYRGREIDLSPPQPAPQPGNVPPTP